MAPTIERKQIDITPLKKANVPIIFIVGKRGEKEHKMRLEVSKISKVFANVIEFWSELKRDMRSL